MYKLLFGNLSDVTPGTIKFLYIFAVILLIAYVGSTGFREAKKDLEQKNQFDESIATGYKQESSPLKFGDYKSQNYDRLLNQFKTTNNLKEFDPEFNVGIQIFGYILVFLVYLLPISLFFGTLKMAHNTNQKMLAQERELEELKKKIGA